MTRKQKYRLGFPVALSRSTFDLWRASFHFVCVRSIRSDDHKQRWFDETKLSGADLTNTGALCVYEALPDPYPLKFEFVHYANKRDDLRPKWEDDSDTLACLLALEYDRLAEGPIVLISAGCNFKAGGIDILCVTDETRIDDAGSLVSKWSCTNFADVAAIIFHELDALKLSRALALLNASTGIPIPEVVPLRRIDLEEHLTSSSTPQLLSVRTNEFEIIARSLDVSSDNITSLLLHKQLLEEHRSTRQTETAVTAIQSSAPGVPTKQEIAEVIKTVGERYGSQAAFPVFAVDLIVDLLPEPTDGFDWWSNFSGLTELDQIHFRAVYDALVETRRRCGEANDGLTFERFAMQLAIYREDIIDKYSCRTVRFVVYAEAGKSMLRAMPVKDSV